MDKLSNSDNKNPINLNINFPKEEAEYLELCAKKKGITLNQMAVYFIIKGIHAFEDELLDKRHAGLSIDEKRSWGEICKELGWEHLDV